MRIFGNIIFCTAAILVCTASFGQQRFGGIAEFDDTVHDFGDIMLTDGPQSCTFTVKNISDKPMAIYSVVSSCGCTDVEWTREPIKAGASGTIRATYSNDEGPYPFDKSITAYISGLNKPVTLRLRGVTHQRKQGLEDIYQVKMGPLGLRNATIAGGSLEQGTQKSDVLTVANLSSKTVKLSIGKTSEGLRLSPSSISISPKSTVTLNWTVTADESRWGLNNYSAELLADGKAVGSVRINASTKGNFSSLSKEERDKGPRPMFSTSTYTFNRVKAGTAIDAVFDLSNSGKSTLKIYKADSDNPHLDCKPVKDLPAGGKTKVNMHLDTAGMPSGEVLIIVTLTTNSPLRPIVNLFVTGWIE